MKPASAAPTRPRKVNRLAGPVTKAQAAVQAWQGAPAGSPVAKKNRSNPEPVDSARNRASNRLFVPALPLR